MLFGLVFRLRLEDGHGLPTLRREDVPDPAEEITDKARLVLFVHALKYITIKLRLQEFVKLNLKLCFHEGLLARAKLVDCRVS